MVTFLQSGRFKILVFSIVFSAIFAHEKSFGQAKFSVVCPQKTIGKNEVLQIQFRLENASNIETINPPSFNNFTVVGGPNQESGMTSINGKTTQYVAIGFYLKPKSTGKFSIKPATAKADGKEFQSAPVTIEVTNSSTAPSNNSANALSPFANFNFDFPPALPTHQFDDYILKPGEKAEDKIQKNLFIKLDVSKTNCYVGEPITASYKLYTRLRSESTITDAPSFNGFSVSDLDVNNNNGGIEKYNGRMYNVYTLRKVQLYPLQAGHITIDPLVANNKVTFIKFDYANSRNSDQFYDMLENFADATSPRDAIVEENITLKSKPVEIVVKPLPSENAPANFKGAVGHFTIMASFEKNKITTDDAGNLKVTINGQGNIQLINAPKINWPAGMDGYEAKVKDEVDKSSVPMRGSKVFTFPFTVSKAGTYQIDSISFSYFDPASASFKTVRTTPLEITVNKGTGIANNLFKTNKPQSTKNSFAVDQTDLMMAIVLLICIGLLILFLFNRKNKNKAALAAKIKIDDLRNEQEEKKPEYIVPENPLLAAHEKLMQANPSEFYHVLDVSLKKYLSGKFNVPAEELTKKRINEELDKCNIGLGTSLMLNNLFEEIELNLYAPPSNADHLCSVFEKASEVVSLLDKQCAEKYIRQ